MDAVSNHLRAEKIDGDAANGLAVTFSTGSAGTSRFELVLKMHCEEDRALSASLPSPPAGYASPVTMEWQTHVTCPSFQAAGALGWTIVAVISAASVLYFGGGAFYNHRQHNGTLQGKELLPHTVFWTEELPELVSNGVHYSRCQLSERFEFLGFLAPTSTHGGGSSSTAKDGLGEEEDGHCHESLLEKQPSKKKKKKSKPLPAAQLDAGTLEWLGKKPGSANDEEQSAEARTPRKPKKKLRAKRSTSSSVAHE